MDVYEIKCVDKNEEVYQVDYDDVVIVDRSFRCGGFEYD